MCLAIHAKRQRTPTVGGNGGLYRFNNITDHRSFFKVKFRFSLVLPAVWFSGETACAVTTREGVYIAGLFRVRGTSVNKVSSRSCINGGYKLWRNLQTVNTWQIKLTEVTVNRRRPTVEFSRCKNSKTSLKHSCNRSAFILVVVMKLDTVLCCGFLFALFALTVQKTQ